MRAARYLNIDPDEMMQRSVELRDRALIAQSAEEYAAAYHEAKKWKAR